MNKINLIAFATSIFLLNGCAVKSIEDFQVKETYKSERIKALVLDNNISGDGSTSFLNLKKEDKSPLLTKPKVAKIIVEPYIDSDGDYHELQKVHIKIEAAKFVDNPKIFTINDSEKGIF